MKDYKPAPNSYEDKLGRAIGYLLERGIWRGKADCRHRYVNSHGKVVVPSLSIYRRQDVRGLPF